MNVAQTERNEKKNKRTAVAMSALRFLSATKTIALDSRPTTVGIPLCGWTEIKHQNKPKLLCVKTITVNILCLASGIIYCKFLNSGETITADDHWQKIDKIH